MIILKPYSFGKVSKIKLLWWNIEYYKDQIINKPTEIIISKEALTDIICNGKCHLYNTKYCKPDDLALYDATICKSFHKEESFKAMNKLL